MWTRGMWIRDDISCVAHDCTIIGRVLGGFCHSPHSASGLMLLAFLCDVRGISGFGLVGVARGVDAGWLKWTCCGCTYTIVFLPLLACTL